MSIQEYKVPKFQYFSDVVIEIRYINIESRLASAEYLAHMGNKLPLPPLTSIV